MNNQQTINQPNLNPVISKYSTGEIEDALITLFINQEELTTNNFRLQTVLNRCNRTALLDLKSLLKVKKINLDLPILVKLFELLHSEKERKLSGTYYTPSLVVDYITTNSISRDSKVMDIACGCGAFLIGAIKRLEEVTGKSRINLIEKNIFGVDISQHAIERAKNILTLFALLNGEDRREIHFNLFCADSLTFNFHKILLENNLPQGFDVIVGNPPYSTLPKNYNISKISPKFKTVLTEGNPPNLYVLFVELMISIVNKSRGSLGVIIPLSLAYSSNKSIQKLRQIISSTNGEWFLSFFDRSPDSLFGDNVKTRNSIILSHFNSKIKNNIAVTKLIRWNSRIRNKLFDNITYQTIEDFACDQYLPKISTISELETLISLKSTKNKLRHFINPLPLLERERDSGYLYYYSTAYNWLPVFKEPPNLYFQTTPEQANNSNKIQLPDSNTDLLYAILNSRLVYWLWLVVGDGFHLTENFLNEIPVNPKSFSSSSLKALTRLGKKLWNKAKKYPIVKTNRGVRVYNFNMLRCAKIIEEIDKVIISELDIAPEFNKFLKNRYLEHVSAGRNNYRNKEYLEVTD